MRVNGKVTRVWAVRFVARASIENPEEKLFKDQDEDII